MWVRLIAREVAASKVVPHDRRSHQPNGNGAIQRQTVAAASGGDAARASKRLAPETAGRLQSTGMGFRENIVGSGTDDLGDSLDRRVEFKVRAC